MPHKPTAPTPAAIGDKSRRIARAAVRGALGGLMWSVPVAVLVHACTLAGAPASLVAQTYLWTILTWVSVAASAAAVREREGTMSEEARRVVKEYANRAAIQSSLFATPVAAFFLWATWGYGAGGAIIGAVVILCMWVGCATLVGGARGTRAARKIDEESLERARNTTLDDRARPAEAGPTNRIRVRTDVHLTEGAAGPATEDVE